MPIREGLGASLRARSRELIAASRPGGRLPSERILAARWGVARMTVRRAMDALIEEGLIVRRRGSGTFVVPQPLVRILGLTSFTQDMRERGLVPSSRLLASRTEAADAELAAALRIGIGDPVITFTRLRSGSGEPMALETVSIPATLVPGLTAEDLAGSLYELLARRYRIVAGAASVRIEPVLPDPPTRRLLGIADDQACLRLRMTDSDHRGRVVMVADCTYRGDRYQLTADVDGSSAGAVHARRAS